MLILSQSILPRASRFAANAREFGKKSLVFLLLLSFLSCSKKDDPDPKSSDTSVLNISVSNPGASSMPVSIDNTNHRIIIKAICPTNQGAITVNPTVAENATCSLAPGTVLDLHGTQTFTVTAEDGTQTEYSIYVTGCSLYGSHFYRGCGVYRQIDCIVQDNNASGMAGSALYLSLNELPDSDGVLEDEFSVTFDLENTNFTSGTPVTYEINPYVGQHSKASFTFYSGAFLYVASPAGTISITNVDTKNKLISGSFSFGQFSNVTCGSGVTTDYIAGEFYSLPY